MIRKVRIAKDQHKTVEVFYKSGKHTTYSHNNIPQSIVDFILEDTTNVHENDYFTWYEK